MLVPVLRGRSAREIDRFSSFQLLGNSGGGGGGGDVWLLCFRTFLACPGRALHGSTGAK